MKNILMFAAVAFIVTVDNFSFAQPAQQTVAISLPAPMWNLTSDHTNGVESIKTFTPPLNSPYSQHTDIVTKILPYANLPGIDSHKYPAMLLKGLQGLCATAKLNVVKQESHSTYFVTVGTSCSGPYTNFLSFIKVFDGVDAIYMVRYDVFDANVSDKEMKIFAKMVNRSSLISNPHYQ